MCWRAPIGLPAGLPDWPGFHWVASTAGLPALLMACFFRPTRSALTLELLLFRGDPEQHVDWDASC